MTAIPAFTAAIRIHHGMTEEERQMLYRLFIRVREMGAEGRGNFY
jgi:hypothetical protein